MVYSHERTCKTPAIKDKIIKGAAINGLEIQAYIFNFNGELLLMQQNHNRGTIHPVIEAQLPLVCIL
jgi:hypothetical protein